MSFKTVFNSVLLTCFCVWSSFSMAELLIDENPSDIKSAFIGEAFDLESGELIYREYHRVFEQADGTVTSKVIYVYADGREKAVKYVDFSSGMLSPSFSLADTQFAYSEQVEMDDKGANISVSGLDLDFTKRFKADGRIPVVDAGFNEFIKANLSDLLAGDKKSFKFLSPTRADTVTLRARYEKTENSLIRILVEPKSFIVRLLMDPIILFYEEDSFQLHSYEGLTNLRKNADRNYEARIEYRYPNKEDGLHAFIDKEFIK